MNGTEGAREKQERPSSQLCVYVCSVVFDSATSWTVATRLLYSWNFPGKNSGVGCKHWRQVYWNRVPFPTPGDLLNLGLKPASLASPALADGFLTTWKTPSTQLDNPLTNAG